jgi:hypothetical protein
MPTTLERITNRFTWRGVARGVLRGTQRRLRQLLRQDARFKDFVFLEPDELLAVTTLLVAIGRLLSQKGPPAPAPPAAAADAKLAAEGEAPN